MAMARGSGGPPPVGAAQAPAPAPAPDWEIGLCDCHAIPSACCCLAFVPCCGDQLVTASALSQMEGGRNTSFHYAFASSCMARNYVAEAYQLPSRPGWNCCLGCCCRGCSAAQLYGHVRFAGPPATKPPTNEAFASNFAGVPKDWKDTVCLDPCNCLHMCLFLHCISAAHVATVADVPFWLPCLYSNYCFNHHVLRVDLGVPGSACWNDCLEPLVCCLLVIPPVTPAGVPGCCCYYAQMLENERKLITQAVKTNAPRMMLQNDAIRGLQLKGGTVAQSTTRPKNHRDDDQDDDDRDDDDDQDDDHPQAATARRRTRKKHLSSSSPLSSEEAQGPTHQLTSSSSSVAAEASFHGWISWLESKFGTIDLTFIGPMQIARTVGGAEGREDVVEMQPGSETETA